MNQQASGIAPVAEPPIRRLGAPFLLFTGGKGGVGKTTLAANLAVQLAREGRKTLLVDLDLGLANVDVLMSLRPTRTLEDVIRGGEDVRSCVVIGAGGVHVLPASSGTGEMARSDAGRRAALFSALASLASDYEVIIGDSAAGIGPDVLSFATVADHVLVVTTPDPAALTDAYGLIKALDAHSHEAGVEVPTPELLINQSVGAAQAESTAASLRGVCQDFLLRSPRMAGWLPQSRVVSASARDQKPFALGNPQALANNCLRRLARRVQRWCPAQRASGFGLKA